MAPVNDGRMGKTLFLKGTHISLNYICKCISVTNILIRGTEFHSFII